MRMLIRWGSRLMRTKAGLAARRQSVNFYAHICKGPPVLATRYPAGAWRATIAANIDACVELDCEVEAIKSTAETREASRQLGRQTLRIGAALISHPLVKAYGRLADDDSVPAHHAVVFGIIGGACQWTAAATAAALLYSSCAALVGAATRLVPLGQTQAQRLIMEGAPLIASLAERAIVTGTDDAFSFAPSLEIAAMRHAQLEARLFKS